MNVTNLSIILMISRALLTCYPNQIAFGQSLTSVLKGHQYIRNLNQIPEQNIFYICESEADFIRINVWQQINDKKSSLIYFLNYAFNDNIRPTFMLEIYPEFLSENFREAEWFTTDLDYLKGLLYPLTYLHNTILRLSDFPSADFFNLENNAFKWRKIFPQMAYFKTVQYATGPFTLSQSFYYNVEKRDRLSIAMYLVLPSMVDFADPEGELIEILGPFNQKNFAKYFWTISQQGDLIYNTEHIKKFFLIPGACYAKKELHRLNVGKEGIKFETVLKNLIFLFSGVKISVESCTPEGIESAKEIVLFLTGILNDRNQALKIPLNSNNMSVNSQTKSITYRRILL